MTQEQKMDFLIQELAPRMEIPELPEHKWQILRGLVNVREPYSVEDNFLKIQDELLQELLLEKGITTLNELHPIDDQLYLWQGDITTLQVDAIVNAANSALLGCFIPNHACIDNAIHTFSGVQLRQACYRLMEEQGENEKTGSAQITPAYNLPSTYVLHTVGPIIQQDKPTAEQCQQLASCYRSCIELADQYKLKSIAFCCISTGEFHFPNRQAAEITIVTVKACLKQTKYVEKVVFNVFKDLDYDIYNELLTRNK